MSNKYSNPKGTRFFFGKGEHEHASPHPPAESKSNYERNRELLIVKCLCGVGVGQRYTEVVAFIGYESPLTDDLTDVLYLCTRSVRGYRGCPTQCFRMDMGHYCVTSLRMLFSVRVHTGVISPVAIGNFASVPALVRLILVNFSVWNTHTNRLFRLMNKVVPCRP